MTVPAVIPLSLLAAFLIAASAALQQRAAGRTSFATRTDNAHAVPGPRLLGELAREPVWVLGWVANISGFCVQAAALHLGSVAEVQPLMVCQLLFALPLGLVGTGRRMSAGAWWGAAGVCAGLAALLPARGRLPAATGVDEPRLAASIGAVAVLAGLLIALSRGRPPAVRAALFGLAAGLFCALSAVLMKEATEQLLTEGLPVPCRTGTVTPSPRRQCAVCCSGRPPMRCGPLAPAVTAMNITNPVVSYVLAVLLYGVPAPDTAGQLLGVTFGAALITAGGGAARPCPRAPPADRPAALTSAARPDRSGQGRVAAGVAEQTAEAARAAAPEPTAAMPAVAAAVPAELVAGDPALAEAEPLPARSGRRSRCTAAAARHGWTTTKPSPLNCICQLSPVLPRGRHTDDEVTAACICTCEAGRPADHRVGVGEVVVLGVDPHHQRRAGGGDRDLAVPAQLDVVARRRRRSATCVSMRTMSQRSAVSKASTLLPSTVRPSPVRSRMWMSCAWLARNTVPLPVTFIRFRPSPVNMPRDVRAPALVLRVEVRLALVGDHRALAGEELRHAARAGRGSP